MLGAMYVNFIMLSCRQQYTVRGVMWAGRPRGRPLVLCPVCPFVRLLPVNIYFACAIYPYVVEGF